MPKAKVVKSSNSTRKIRPALSPEARENQLISLAVDLVEQRLLDGTATSQETTHFLKLGSTKNRLELERMKEEIELSRAKRKAIDSGEEMKELYENAIEAMKAYSGHGDSYDEY